MAIAFVLMHIDECSRATYRIESNSGQQRVISGLFVSGQVIKVLEGHTSSVYTVAISADGGKIVSGSDDKTVRVWSMQTGEVRIPVCSKSTIRLRHLVK